MKKSEIWLAFATAIAGSTSRDITEKLAAQVGDEADLMLSEFSKRFGEPEDDEE